MNYQEAWEFIEDYLKFGAEFVFSSASNARNKITQVKDLMHTLEIYFIERPGDSLTDGEFPEECSESGDPFFSIAYHPIRGRVPMYGSAFMHIGKLHTIPIERDGEMHFDVLLLHGSTAEWDEFGYTYKKDEKFDGDWILQWDNLRNDRDKKSKEQKKHIIPPITQWPETSMDGSYRDDRVRYYRFFDPENLNYDYLYVDGINLMAGTKISARHSLPLFTLQVPTKLSPNAKDLKIDKRLLKQYPKEMRKQLQDVFWDYLQPNG